MERHKLLPDREYLDLRETALAISNASEPPSGSYAGYQAYGSYGPEEEGIHLREYLRRLRRHKWLIISLVLIITTLATLYAYQIKPWYTASAVLEIGKDNSAALKGEITLTSDTDSEKDINTKILAFSNPKLFEKVAEELHLTQDPNILASFHKKPFYSFIRGSNTNDQTPKSDDPVEDEKQKLALLGGYIQKGVAVEEVKNTRAIKISYTDENPETAQKVANSVAKLFRDTSFESQTEKYTNSVNWLDSSTRELKAQVQMAEEALDNYGRNNQIFSTAGGSAESSKDSTLTGSNLSKLNDQYMRAHTEQILKRTLYEQVKAGRLEELPEAFSDPKITTLQGQISGLERQAAELRVNYGPKNPKIMEVENQIPVLTSQLEASRKALELKLKAEYERTLQNERSLGAALSQAKSAASSENQASIKLNILKQDVDTARGLYTDFLKSTSEAKTRAAEQNNNIKFIQEAQKPGAPVGPNRLNLILAAFAFSLGAGVGLALFLEYLNNTIKSLDDVERYTQLPTLGLIPAMGRSGKNLIKRTRERKQVSTGEDGSQLGLETRSNQVQLDLLALMDNHSMIGEAYRALRTSLLLSTAGNAPKTILVTSAQSGEGKTTTAVNTAISLTQLGKKVLIIDCDLRRPSVHRQLDVSSAKGLTNYLVSECELAEVIQELKILNLSVIASGPIPPNPAELLSSRKMRETIDKLSESYDHIILDSPPIINVTDPVILSTMVDGTIFVIQGGRTPREVVQRSRQDLRNVNSRIFGVVLNNIDIHKNGHDYYSYYKYSNYQSPGEDIDG